jgi:valyl-tRNA synthetase
MSIPDRYNPAEAEPRWQAAWATHRLYEFDPTDPRPLFVIDTPPPTVSGEITIGHVYSYVQAECMARYQRMRGYNVYYPFGFDDNGLPTERFVERKHNIRAHQVGRAAFVEACLATTHEIEGRFEQFWRSLGFSVDWRLRYSTISKEAQRISQWSFLDLHRKGLIYRSTAPNPWCNECRTAIAQAEIDELPGPDGQPLRVHERCGTPLEIRATAQWYVRVLDAKEALLAAGRQIAWYPAYMQARYEHWVENLAWDWCISRQRFYGVPFPAWHCTNCGGTILADESQLPVDPLAAAPPQACPCGGALRPDEDVMDTWATSALSPQIAARMLEEPGQFGRLFPMHLRPQGHDIIRTWAFYTIAKALFHFDALPWQSVMVSGHALDPSGRKISKSKNNAAFDPNTLIARHSADALRYWACNASLGSDQPINEETMRQGRRFINKLWSAGRLLAGHQAKAAPETGLPTHRLIGSPAPADRALLSALQRLIADTNALMERYEYALALAGIERFFWATFCDTYLELVKGRLYDGDATQQAAALHTSLFTFGAILKLLAPFMPHICEELHRLLLAPGERDSIHQAAYPSPEQALHDEVAEHTLSAIEALIAATRRAKTARKTSLGAPVAEATIGCADDNLRRQLQDAAYDLRAVMRAGELSFSAHGQGEELMPGLWLDLRL